MRAGQIPEDSGVLAARIYVDDIDQFTERHAADLSAGGIFVPMSPPLPMGTELNLEFYFEGQRRMIPGKAMVLRTVRQRGEGGSQVGMQVHFTELGVVAKKFMELLIQRYNLHHPSGILELPDVFLDETDGDLLPSCCQTTESIQAGSEHHAGHRTTRSMLLDLLPDGTLSRVLHGPDVYPEHLKTRTARLLKLREDGRSS